MSLKPLDLQTLFGHLNEVGKHQSHLKNSIAAQQTDEARKLVEQEIQRDHSVNQATEDQETGKVDEEGNPQQQAESEKERKEEEEQKQKEEIRDPNLGQNIDLLG